LKEEEFLWEPDIQKGQIRNYLNSQLNTGFPFHFYYYKWHIYRDDPEDFELGEVEFQNLIDENTSESDVDLGQRLIRERREIYQRAIREAGGVLEFASGFFFDHIVRKTIYSIPVVGTAMMVYDLAQLASELPDDVRAFSTLILDGVLDDEDI
jgi:hypothetical protein